MKYFLTFLLMLSLAEAEPRSWTRTDGKPVTGELIAVNVIERTVTIKTSIMTGILPIESFSQADHVYIADYLRRVAGEIYQPQKPREKMQALQLDLTCRECGTKTRLRPNNMGHSACEAAARSAGWTLGHVVIQENGNLRKEQIYSRCDSCREKLTTSLRTEAEVARKPQAKRPKRVIRPPQAVREDWRTFPDGL
jgi:hypothetical protein